MSSVCADVFTGLGLIITVIGAFVTARAAMLTDEQAIHIGVARFSSGDERDLQQPAVQNLLSASKHAQIGLFAVSVGTFLQLVPIIAKYVPF